jgi:hypothetical protein
VHDYAELGFACDELRPATTADVSELSGSWGRRLGIPDRRAAWLLRLRVSSGAESPLLTSGTPTPDRA